MARTPSKMLPLGTIAPDFFLLNTLTGKTVSLSDSSNDIGILIMFICNHCPFVKHLEKEIATLGNWATDMGLDVIAISSNDIVQYPEDSPDQMKVFAEKLNFKFPYVYDESQEVAKKFDAACTPDFYLFDSDKKLVYRGQFDNSRPGNEIPVTGESLRNAISSIIAGEEITIEQLPSLGCNIKWKT
jgi:peroxiredoxin